MWRYRVIHPYISFWIYYNEETGDFEHSLSSYVHIHQTLGSSSDCGSCIIERGYEAENGYVFELSSEDIQKEFMNNLNIMVDILFSSYEADHPISGINLTRYGIDSNKCTCCELVQDSNNEFWLFINNTIPLMLKKSTSMNDLLNHLLLLFCQDIVDIIRHYVSRRDFFD